MLMALDVVRFEVFTVIFITSKLLLLLDCLCVLMVRFPGYRSRDPGSITGATRFSDKWWVWKGVHSASRIQLRSYLEEVAAPV
jgi:hypothetical protein